MSVTMTEAVASSIRAELGRRRITQSALARQIGMSRTAISRRLNGELSLSLDEIEAIAAALDIPAAQLLGTDGQI